MRAIAARHGYGQSEFTSHVIYYWGLGSKQDGPPTNAEIWIVHLQPRDMGMMDVPRRVPAPFATVGAQAFEELLAQKRYPPPGYWEQKRKEILAARPIEAA
ncbi:MAG: hypothetical protein SF172_16970 [Burkholderiales bacterium]|nr:hypothetical protein [Burkholderiales bacterium]